MNRKVAVSLGLLMSLSLVGCDSDKDDKLATIGDSSSSTLKYKTDVKNDRVNTAMASLVEKRLDSGLVKSNINIDDIKRPSKNPNVLKSSDIVKLSEKISSDSGKSTKKDGDKKDSSVLDIKEAKLDMSSQSAEDKALLSVINAGYTNKSKEEIEKIVKLQSLDGMGTNMTSDEYQKTYEKFNPKSDDRIAKNDKILFSENPYYKNPVDGRADLAPKIDKNFEYFKWSNVPLVIKDGDVEFEVFSLDISGDVLVGHYSLTNTKDKPIKLKYGLVVDVNGNLNPKASFAKFAVMDDYNSYPTSLDAHQKYHGTFYVNVGDYMRSKGLVLGFSSVNTNLRRLQIDIN